MAPLLLGYENGMKVGGDSSLEARRALEWGNLLVRVLELCVGCWFFWIAGSLMLAAAGWFGTQVLAYRLPGPGFSAFVAFAEVFWGANAILATIRYSLVMRFGEPSLRALKAAKRGETPRAAAPDETLLRGLLRPSSFDVVGAVVAASLAAQLFATGHLP